MEAGDEPILKPVFYLAVGIRTSARLCPVEERVQEIPSFQAELCSSQTTGVQVKAEAPSLG